MTATPKAPLGRLIKVPLREAWVSEPGDFTPWLALPENISLLGGTLGMELEVQGTEQEVGPFRADILCRDAADGRYVLIENQLERTDHTHLGQIITYAAGLEAATIIWIAQSFTQEHRAALDWLNAGTKEEFAFFGLEVELWRIGDSDLAPKFNIVSKPNDWVSAVRRDRDRGPLTPDQQARLDFWTRLRDTVVASGGQLRMGEPSYGSYAYSMLRPPHLRLCAATEKNGTLARIYLQADGPDKNAYFALIRDGYRRQVDERLAPLGPVDWRELPDSTVSQISVKQPMNLADVSSWQRTIEWMTGGLETMHALFEPIVRDLDPSQVAPLRDAEDGSEVGESAPSA